MPSIWSRVRMRVPYFFTRTHSSCLHNGFKIYCLHACTHGNRRDLLLWKDRFAVHGTRGAQMTPKPVQADAVRACGQAWAHA